MRLLAFRAQSPTLLKEITMRHLKTAVIVLSLLGSAACSDDSSSNNASGGNSSAKGGANAAGGGASSASGGSTGGGVGGSSSMAGAATVGGAAAIGTPCTTPDFAPSAECNGGYCTFATEPYCTQTGCTDTPSLCPTDYVCNPAAPGGICQKHEAGDGSPGADCTVDADCVAPANYCTGAPPPQHSYCTMKDCAADPSICPPDWTCFDPETVFPGLGLPTACTKPM